jgi:hypothetical protein
MEIKCIVSQKKELQFGSNLHVKIHISIQTNLEIIIKLHLE